MLSHGLVDLLLTHFVVRADNDFGSAARRESEERQIDKLGVTGSSPVPPIEKPCK
jgi:hypothetical protein